MDFGAKNRKGGAALAAVLIMIILIAAGTTIMVVSGRGQIKQAEELPIVASKESKPDESESEPDSEPDSQVESEPEPEVRYPEPTLSEKFREVSVVDDGFATKNIMLLNVDKNEIVAGSHYDEKIYPASLTKIMTLIVAVENVSDQNVQFKFTNEMLAPLVEEKASVVGFSDGESVPFKDLLYGAVLVSGADATSALAKLIAGSEPAFVDMMNAKAKALGLTDTHFMNASGLHDDNHYSTCKDMAIIFAYALQNPLIKEVISAPQYVTAKTTQHPDGITLYSIVHSRFMGYYIDADGDKEADKDTKFLGGKTGFTDEAGYALETVIEKKGELYIGINCMTPKDTVNAVVRCTEDNIRIYETFLK